MRARGKVGLIALGYVGALLVAAAIVAVHVAMTAGPDRQWSHGMYAFGDSLVFLGAFGVAAVPATGGALFFLRPYRWFWRVLSVVALVIAAGGLLASIAYFAWSGPDTGSVLDLWASLSPVRVLVAPLFGMFFVLAGLFAPDRSSRIALFMATFCEMAAFASVAGRWLGLY